MILCGECQANIDVEYDESLTSHACLFRAASKYITYDAYWNGNAGHYAIQ